MLIILEGVDGSGKSTLAEEIASKINGAKILHRGVPVEHVLDEYETPLFDYVPGSGEPIVCDRWHVGPDVYGPIKRNDNGLDPVIRWHIENYLLAKGAFLLYTEMTLEPLLERMQLRGEDYLAPNEVADVIHLYREVISKTLLPHELSIEGIHNAWAVIAHGIQNENNATHLGAFKSYVGGLRPKRLYVGLSDTKIAYMPYENSYGYKVIKTYGMSQDVGFVNANDDVVGLWNALRKPEVFVLDEDGVKECFTHDIPFTYLGWIH